VEYYKISRNKTNERLVSQLPNTNLLENITSICI
jgi:hypothetical protein